MIDLDQFRQTFFEECDDYLATLEAQLMEFQAGEATTEGIEEAFRAIHSIKGGAGAFGFKRIIAFSHEFESLLDQVRGGQLELSDDIKSAALRAFDVLSDLINGERNGVEPAPGYETGVAGELSAFLIDDASGQPDEPAKPDVAAPAQQAGGLQRYRVLFTPSPTMLQRGNEPILLIRELRLLGNLNVELDDTRLPALGEIEPSKCYLGWSIDLESECSQADIEEIFEFVEGDCEFDISQERIESGSVSSGTQPAAARPSAAGMPENGGQPDDGSMPAVPAKTGPAGPAPTREQTYTSIRVDLERIDRMVNMVGEIVIAQAAILQQVDDPLNQSHPQLVENLQQFLRHTQNLQDSVMAIRAQPVKSIFDRMPRLVRELSKQTGKKVRLITSGEETEIDKTVIERLTDPLTHMMRNAVDHGVETPEQRAAAGKAEEGTLRLNASQRGSHIIIELSDDGKGLDREGIRRKAVERGLIAADAQLSEQETDNLIFKPGFSTADSVSSISGRGVGMDVVNENIRKLGGRAAIRSVEGAGSTVTLILPLTLAVMDGMVVRIGPTSFIVPLTSIIESLAIGKTDTAFLPQHGEVLRFREHYVKVYDLHKLFGFARQANASGSLLMVMETDDGQLIGLRVDEIIGQQQVVVKTLENNFNNTPCVSGGSIMGNGAVALILDVSGLRDLEAARRDEDDDPDPQASHDEAA